jgi:hypothetical protein
MVQAYLNPCIRRNGSLVVRLIPAMQVPGTIVLLASSRTLPTYIGVLPAAIKNARRSRLQSGTAFRNLP